MILELALKSTLDYYCNQVSVRIRQNGDPEVASLLSDGLDNLVTIDANTKNKAPAVLWHGGTLKPAPLDPLYEFDFSVGVKTTNDDANYVMAKLLSLLSSSFQVGTDIPILDYSVKADDLVGMSEVGAILITNSTSQPMLYDNQSGLKMLNLTAKVMRYL